MNNHQINSADLILNDDGSIYHLHLKPEHVAPTVILVGDQGRVHKVSRHFESIEYKISNREFVTHTGIYKNKRISVLSTGIGTDNIDIVLNEIDAIVNVDLSTRLPKEHRKKLNLIRIGTSGSLQGDVPVGSFLLSEFGLGFEGLIYYYKHAFANLETELGNEVNKHLNWPSELSKPYIIAGSKKLIKNLEPGMIKGITATATGFYGPQNRSILLENSLPNLNQKLTNFKYQDYRITNFEMETSALYALSSLMGHHAATCCAIIANRINKNTSKNYKLIVEDLIEYVLNRIVLLS